MNLPPSWKAEIEEAVQKTTDTTSERQKTENEKNTSEIIGAIKSFVDAYKAQHDKPERKDKIKRTLDIATVALLFGTALFTGLGWWVFRGQLIEMQGEQRPWLYADIPVITDNISINRNGWFDFPVKFTIHNVGHAPAMAAMLSPVAKVFKSEDGTPTNLIKIRDYYCPTTGGPTKSGRVVFPNQTYEQNTTFGIDGREWAKSVTIGGLVNSYIVGCVAYRFPELDTIHWTGFVYGLNRKTAPVMPPDPTSVPFDQIIVTPLEFPDAFQAN